MPAASAAATPMQAAAAVSTAKIHPYMWTSANTRTVNKGATVKITAKLVDPRNGKRITTGSVRMQVLYRGKWTTVSAKKLGSSGRTTVAAKATFSSKFRAQYAGTSRISAVSGGGIRVTVRSSAGARILAEARRHTGALYKFGAAGPTRFDCSGYTQYVYRKTTGKKLPHKANAQQHYGSAVSKSSARPGDLIVFRSGSYGYHAAIYAGGGYMYDSPHTGARISKRKIHGSNYVVRRLAA
jgi:cell wall-associated NlpC family hydrolase